MNLRCLPLVVLLPCLCLAVEDHVTPYRPNLMSKVLDQILEGFLNSTSLEDIHIKDVANLTSMEMKTSNWSKEVDGKGSWGFALKIKMDELFLRGRYELKEIEILKSKSLVLCGKGNFSAHLEGVAAEVVVQASLNFDTDKFEVTMPVFNVSLDKAKLKVENFLNDPSLSDFLSELLSHLLPDFLKLLSSFSSFFQPLVEYVVNEVIWCIKTESLSGKLEECLRNITQVTYQSALGEDVAFVLQNLPRIE